MSEKDYWKRSDGTIVTTILNNEIAAIKKCEELYNILGDNEAFHDKDFGDQSDDINGTPGQKDIKPNAVVWYRINKISSNIKPIFIDETASSEDVIKGGLKNNWFISALTILANKQHFLKGEFRAEIFNDKNIDKKEFQMLSFGVYPPIFHYFAKKNIYCFKFYKDFRWKYVIIDDRLPCLKTDNYEPKLIYSRCKKKNEFWVPLIEKAYAKLHGSYESLNFGMIIKLI